MTCIGVIGGTGLDNPEIFVPETEEYPNTRWGKPSSPLRKGRIKDCAAEIVLLSRHGLDHVIPPHKINNRANIQALKDAGCDYIVASAACGSLRDAYGPGSLVVPDQFIDFTRKRDTTFFDSFAVGDARHTAMADPFAPLLRNAMLAAAKDAGFTVHDGATLVTIEGPRFSTRAESRMFRTLGCDLINMTVAPECILANEANIPYAVMAMVTDYDSWSTEHPPLTMDALLAVLAANVDKILQVFLGTFARLQKA